MYNALVWSLEHEVDKRVLEKIVTGLGFEIIEGKKSLYVQRISTGVHWREMKVSLKSGEVVCYLLKERESTTELYFDYLVTAGFIIGKIAAEIESAPKRGEHWGEEGEEEEEGEAELEQGEA